MSHINAAVSENAFRKSFELLRDSLRWNKSGSTDFGPFTAGYHVRGHLEGGSVDFRNDNTIQFKEIDIKWDQLQVTLGIDIPGLCVGGGCIDLPWPLPDICLPEYCVFGDNPDVSISPDFAAFVAQEISFTGSIQARYYDASLPPPPWYNPCALLRSALTSANIIEALPNHNQWQLFIDTQTVDIDLFDFPDIVGDLFENALTNAITNIIPGGWVRDLVLYLIHGIAQLIRTILDIPDDIQEWLSDLFNVSFGLFDFLVQMILDFFGNCVPIYRIDDPFEIMAAEVNNSVLLSGAPVTLVPVKIPIRNLAVGVSDVELAVQADIGA